MALHGQSGGSVARQAARCWAAVGQRGGGVRREMGLQGETPTGSSVFGVSVPFGGTFGNKPNI